MSRSFEGEEKRKFKVALFSLLTDYINDKLWTYEQAQKLNERIETLSRADKEFVKRSITYYENKLGCKVCVALAAAQGD